MAKEVETRFRFVASGQESVLGAYKSINTAAQGSGRAQSSAADAASRKQRAASIAAERQVAKDAQSKARAEERASRDAANAQDRAAKDAIKSQERLTAATLREAKKRADGEMREARRAQQQRNAVENYSRTRGIGSLGARAAGAALTLGMGAAAATVGAVGAAARGSMTLGDIATAISVKARMPGKEAVDPAVLKREFEQTALATPGVKATDVAEAVQEFVKMTGELDIARKNMGVLAVAAQATSTDLKETGAMAAYLFKKFEISNPEELGEAIARMNTQGKKSAFMMEDFAHLLGEMGASAKVAGFDKGVKGAAMLGGMAQMAKETAATPEEAATAVKRLVDDIIKHAPRLLKKTGFDVYTDKSKMRLKDMDVLVPEIIKEFKGNLQDIEGFFGQRSFKAVANQIVGFRTAYEATPGTEKEKLEAGHAAAQKMISDIINAGGSMSDLQADAAMMQKTSSAQLTAAWEQLQAETSDKLVPALIALIPQLSNLAGHMGPVIDGFTMLAEAIGTVLDIYQSPEQKKKRYQGDMERLDKEMGALGLNVTPEHIARKKELENKIGGVVAQEEVRNNVAKGLKFMDNPIFKLMAGAPFGPLALIGAEKSADIGINAMDKLALGLGPSGVSVSNKFAGLNDVGPGATAPIGVPTMTAASSSQPKWSKDADAAIAQFLRSLFGAAYKINAIDIKPGESATTHPDS